MGIEPTSEAWEACCMHKNAQIGGNLTFFKILKWIPIGAAGAYVIGGHIVPSKLSAFTEWLSSLSNHSRAQKLRGYFLSQRFDLLHGRT
jgi:hypothetical protein